MKVKVTPNLKIVNILYNPWWSVKTQQFLCIVLKIQNNITGFSWTWVSMLPKHMTLTFIDPRSKLTSKKNVKKPYEVLYKTLFIFSFWHPTTSKRCHKLLQSHKLQEYILNLKFFIVFRCLCCQLILLQSYTFL